MARNLEELKYRRNMFYRDSYRRIFSILVFMVFLSAVLAGYLVRYTFTPHIPDYYATTSDGQVVGMYPLSKPMITNEFLLQWSSTVARTVYTLSFAQYQSQLQNVSGFFTKDGYAALMGVFNGGVLSSITGNKLEATAIVNGPPVILTAMVVGGRFTWLVQLPLLVTYVSASTSQKQELIVTMQVQRIPSVETPKGIAVNSFSAEKKGGSMTV